MSVTMDTCPACHSVVGPQDAYCQRCGKRLGGARGTAGAVPAPSPGSPAQPTTFAGPPVGAPRPGSPTSVPLRDLGSLAPALAGAGAAPVGTRLGAGVIDGIVNAVATLVVYGAVYRGLAVPIVLVYLVALILFWAWNAATGLTIGRSATGLRLVSADTGGAPGWGRTAGRSLILGAFGGLTCGLLSWLPLGSILWDRDDRSRGWHDKWSRTVVIDIRHGRDTLAGAVPVPGVAPAQPWSAAPQSLTPPPPRPVTPPAPVPAVVAPPAPPAPVAAVVPPAPPAPAAPAGGVISAVPGVAPAPREAPAAVPAGADPAHVLSFRPSRPGSPPPDVSLDDADRTVMRAPRRPVAMTLAFDTGERVSLTGGLGLVGRDPQPRPDEHVDHLVPIADPERSVSKTHLSFGVDAAGLWVRDRGSTNGVRVLRGDAVVAEVGMDEPSYVAVGDTVEFGDRRFTVQKG